MDHGEVLIESIDLNANLSIQTRVALDADALERYQEALRNERDDVERVVLFQDVDRNYWIADGHHRCRAQLALNPDVPIRAEIRPGDKLDALKYALKANARHGLPRNANDLKKALALAEDYHLVDSTDKHAVAEILGCSIRQAERLTRPARSKARRERDKEILIQQTEGKTAREIAANQNVSLGTVSAVFRKRHVAETEQQEKDKDSVPPVSAYDDVEESLQETVEHDSYLPQGNIPDCWNRLAAALSDLQKELPDQDELVGSAPSSTWEQIVEIQSYLTDALQKARRAA